MTVSIDLDLSNKDIFVDRCPKCQEPLWARERTRTETGIKKNLFCPHCDFEETQEETQCIMNCGNCKHHEGWGDNYGEGCECKLDFSFHDDNCPWQGAEAL